MVCGRFRLFQEQYSGFELFLWIARVRGFNSWLEGKDKSSRELGFKSENKQGSVKDIGLGCRV